MPPANVLSILGKRRAPDKSINLVDLDELSKKGISKSALLHLAKYLNLSERQIAELLPVSLRTVQRYSGKMRFDRMVSEQIFQIAVVAARGIEVFEDKSKFLSWLSYPNRALGNRTPTSLLGSRFGTEMVLNELGRIEYGVIS
jgi:putative toxin-antitoxin system antitoxin component (TIGR02293 family)